MLLIISFTFLCQLSEHIKLICEYKGEVKHERNGSAKLLPDEKLLGVGKVLGIEGYACPNATWTGVPVSWWRNKEICYKWAMKTKTRITLVSK